jgi:hypothetical protein
MTSADVRRPRPRPGHVLDPDGNNVETVFHGRG